MLSLGAVNKKTGEYVYTKIANKKEEYCCPECNKDVILCQGEIRVHYFRHKFDEINPCNHYSKPTETQLHKDAKRVMKSLLDRKIPVSFIRKCCECKNDEEYEIPEISESSIIQLEHRFEYKGPKIADIAYLEGGEIFCIFEICNSHKTKSENRPDPWFEIDAETIIRMANILESNEIKLQCIRCEKCENCIQKEEIKISLRKNNLLSKILEKRKKSQLKHRLAIQYGDDLFLAQQKKWTSLYELVDKTKNIDDIENSSALKNEIGSHVELVHPISKICISFNLIRDCMRSISYIQNYSNREDKEYYLKKWLNEYPNKFEDIKKWFNEYPNKFETTKKWYDDDNFLVKLNAIYTGSLHSNFFYTDEILSMNTFDYKIPKDLMNSYQVFHWKIENVINWLNGDGLFDFCNKCNSIFSYADNKLICNNKYCNK